MRPRHLERHRTERIGWLRAAVLGANDGIVSTASLIVGVAAAGTERGEVMVAGLAALVAAEPPRFTASGRLEEIPSEASRALLAGFDAAPAALAAFLAGLGEALATVNRTDGLRLMLASGRVLHMRPSGNAPEFRLYAEAESPDLAEHLLQAGMNWLQAAFD